MANTAYEVEDFSGGNTDFFLQGGKSRYQFSDNLLINEDRKLFVRPGSEGYSQYYLKHRLEELTRIGTFLTFREKRELLVQQARKIFYEGATSWNEITGPEGAAAIGVASAHDAISWAEWKGHTYFTSSGGGLPGKLYRNPAGEFQVRTVGLPLPATRPRYSKAGLLAACITLANDLRSSMIAHISDLNIHADLDKYALALFQVQALAATDTRAVPTPAPAASDEATLYALVKALNDSIELQGPDAGDEGFHTAVTIKVANASVQPPKGPFQRLTDNGTPDTVERAAAQLDELRQKWLWHRLGLFTHSSTNSLVVMDRYPTTAPAIGSTDTAGLPYVASNVSEVVRYANYLKSAYNRHVSNDATGADWNSGLASTAFSPHLQLQNTDQPSLVTVPDATDLDSAYLLIYWVWALYGAVHYRDSNIATHTNFTFDCAGGTADITDVKNGVTTLTVGAWVIAGSAIFDDPEPKNRYTAKVTASGAGTATLSKQVLAVSADQAAQQSTSVYHGSFVSSALTSITATVATADELLDPSPGSGLTANNIALPTTLEEWVAKAQATFVALSFHTQNLKMHPSIFSVGLSGFCQGNGNFYLPQIASYGYAFVYKYTYQTENGVEFQTESAPLFVGPIETAKQHALNTVLTTGLSDSDPGNELFENAFVNVVPSAYLSNLPALANNALTNYDVTSITLEIFRTQDGGNTYYLLDSVVNGVSTFTDDVSDTERTADSAILSDRDPLYTTGGEVAHDQVPPSRFMHVFLDTAYFGYITDAGQVFSDRILQSIPGALDAVPADFSYDLGDELMGITSTRANVVALCRHSLHRLQGGYTNLGQGALTAERIQGEMGCISSKSIVQTEIGIFFAGTDGFYYTDGFQLIKISIDLNKTYAAFTKTEAQASRIHGTYDRRTRRIWWSVQTESSASDCDATWVYYLDYGVKPAGVFTGPVKNGTHWAPSAIAFLGDEMIRGDRRGLLFRHNEKWKSDPKIPSDSSLFDNLDQWGKVHVPYLYRSCALDFGTIAKGNYVTGVNFLGANKGNAAIQFASIADNNNFAASKKDFGAIRHRGNLVWGDPRTVWGDEDVEWKTDGQLDYRRKAPSGNLRAQLKQIEIRPALIGVYKYEEYPEGAYASVDVSELKATIMQPTGYTDVRWPQDCVGMVIAFQIDEYVTEYPITQWFYDEITFTDADGVLTDLDDLENQEWVIRGYMKEAGFHMLGYSIDVAVMGERGNSAIGGGGENAS